MKDFKVYVNGVKAYRLTKGILKETSDFTDGEFLGMVAGMIDEYCREKRKDYRVIASTLSNTLKKLPEELTA